MPDNVYPSLYQAADKASIQAQKKYTILMGIDLLFMILAALLAIYNSPDESVRTCIYYATGILLLLSLIITIIIKSQKFEDVWYQGRAVAESIKTLTWRYITCSENFENTFTQEQADEIFMSKITSISKELKDLNKHLDAKILSQPNITLYMRAQRNKSLEARKQCYIDNRIEDQKNWYSNKAQYNIRKRNLWFGVILASQALGIVSAGLLIKYPNSNWNVMGLFTTISSSVIGWLQLKQHQELKQAYTTAALELNLIVERSYTVKTEADFAKFVLDSENAISREHTLWLAQQRKY